MSLRPRSSVLVALALMLASGPFLTGQPRPDVEAQPFFEVLRIEHVRLAEGMLIPDGAELRRYEEWVVLWGRVPSLEPYLPRALPSDQIMLGDNPTRFLRHPLAGPSCAIILPRKYADPLTSAELWRLSGQDAHGVLGKQIADVPDRTQPGDAQLRSAEKRSAQIRSARRKAKRAGPIAFIALQPAIQDGRLQPEVKTLEDTKTLRDYVNVVAESLERKLRTSGREEGPP